MTKVTKTEWGKISIQDDYERGFIDGMAKQTQSSVDKAVNAMSQRKEWVGLTKEERKDIFDLCEPEDRGYVAAMVEAKLKEKNT
jgi:acyl-CoA reductase-like NAD-dependent aldehyde dehydrogenase